MAALACAILETPESVWTPADGCTEKAKLGKWLDTINHHDLPGCNWLLFRVLVNLALDSVGMPCSMQQAAADMAEVDKWYVGRRLVLRWAGRQSSRRRTTTTLGPSSITRCCTACLPPGATPPAQRSTVSAPCSSAGSSPTGLMQTARRCPLAAASAYRIGQSAFYAACIWAGLEPLPLPVMKGIIVRNLNWWLARPIFDRDGVLTIGYGYPQMYMAEQYNAPGSPYWGLKVFLLLALPDDHPFWACRGRAPARGTDRVRASIPQPSADLLLQRLPDGQLNAYSPANYEKGDHGQFAGKVRQVRLQHSVRLLRQPQLCAAGAGRSRQHAGLCH